jgi:leader peptidase (prepilin peptidase) / N-methyltransferase
MPAARIPAAMILPLALLACGMAVLVWLSIIDIRIWILPDKLNLALALLGIGFHFATGFEILEPHQAIFGALTGAGFLYLIRMGGNAYYKEESLGLGDVKLLGAAGLWLGPEATILSIILGAAAGIVHGMILAGIVAARSKAPYSLKRLALPAGPGFCVGIALAALWAFGPYFGLWPERSF